MTLFLRTSLSIPFLLLLATFTGFSQIDTSLVGFRNRPNEWLGENTFTAPLRLFRQPAVYPGHTAFTAQISDSARVTYGVTGCEHPTLNPNGYSTTSISFGINVEGNLRKNPSEPSFAYTIEDDYEIDGQRMIEYHMAGLTAGGLGIRPETAEVFRETGRGKRKQFGFDYFTVSNGSSSIGPFFHLDAPNRKMLLGGTISLRDTANAATGNNVEYMRMDAANRTLEMTHSFIRFQDAGVGQMLSLKRSDTLTTMRILSYDSAQRTLFVGSSGDADDYYRLPRLRLAARQVSVAADAYASSLRFEGMQTLTTTSTTFGKDSAQLATKGYIDARVAAALDSATALVSDSLTADTRAAVAIRDSLDANARAYATESWVTSQGYLTGFTESDPVFSANGMKYADTAQVLYGRTHAWGQAQRYETTLNGGLLDEMYTSDDSTLLVHRGYVDSRISGGVVGPSQLADSLDVNAREYVTRSELTDTLDADARVTIRPPHALGGSVIDWSLAEVFTDTLSANMTYTFSNAQSGKTIVVALTNTQADYSVTWPQSVRWPGGLAPAQTKGAKTDIYTFIRIGPVLYGSAVQDFDN
jgi:hypothetical protein